MARYTKKRQYRKKAMPSKKYTMRMYGGDYGEHVKGLMSDVAGTFADDIAEKTSEIIKDKLSSDFGEKVAEKAADKVIISMAQVFQDAAAKIAEKEPLVAPLMSDDLGEVREEMPTDSSPMEESPMEEPPMEESPMEESPMEETPVEETPVEETPVDEPPVEETPVEETPVEETPVEETPVEESNQTPTDLEEGKENGPPVPMSEEETKTGEGDMAPPLEKTKGGKSRALRGKKRNTSRNRRNKQRQYQSQYY
jgi:hypothetical protein